MKIASKIFLFFVLIVTIVFVFKKIENHNQKVELQTIEFDNPIDIQNPAGTMPPAWYPLLNPSKITNQNIKIEKVIFDFEGKQNENLYKYKIKNYTSKDIKIRTQDGSLLMVQEAQNEKGEWQAIEYWQWDWGIKQPIFETYFLKTKEEITFIAPQYKGSFKTKIRFKLKLEEKSNDYIYSKGFDASINTSQFILNNQKTKGKVEIWK
jgi:hypothetical protein